MNAGSDIPSLVRELRRMRLSLRMAQAQAAKEIGVSRLALRGWENETSVPREAARVAIRRWLEQAEGRSRREQEQAGSVPQAEIQRVSHENRELRAQVQSYVRTKHALRAMLERAIESIGRVSEVAAAQHREELARLDLSETIDDPTNPNAMPEDNPFA